MQQLPWIVIALVWLAGSFVRIYKQARYFQIEEYQIRRYLRWGLKNRARILPNRTIIAVVIGSGFSAILSKMSTAPLPEIVGIITGIVAVWPPDEGEIKKEFRRTQRATRILGAALLIAAANLSFYLYLLNRLDLNRSVLAVTLAGLLVYLAAPLLLSLGNILLSPVETFLRRRFIAQAKSILATIQPTVIGITGSYGKTTTKNFLTHILNGRYKVYSTPKSYNTLMGVCRAINEDLAGDYSIEYFIVEMGAYVAGEIRRICQLTPPYISIVVEVGPQHYERFGSIEGIVAAKYEIIAALPPDGVAVLNWDNPQVRGMGERGYPNTRITVSKNAAAIPAYADGGPRWVATNINETLSGLTFTVTDRQTSNQEVFIVPILGEHNVTNILLAIAVAAQEGMSLREIAFRARTLQPVENRLTRTITPEGITVLNDAYSANPAGVVGALKVLGLHDTGRRLVVTPGIVELGALHESENRQLGQLLALYATDVILVGAEQTTPIKAGLESAGFPAANLRIVPERRDALRWIQEQLKSGDTVLFLNDLPDTY